MITHPTPYDDLIHQVSNTYGLAFDLLQGQVVAESAGDPWACRYEAEFFRRYIKGNPQAKAAVYGPFAACSVGLLQIIVEVAYEEGYDGRPEGLWVPRVALSFGAKKLAALLTWASQDYPKALSAYNGGKGLALAGGPPYRNQAYIDKVYALAGRS